MKTLGIIGGIGPGSTIDYYQTIIELLLRDPSHNGVPFLNTTRIHCEAAVAKMLS